MSIGGLIIMSKVKCPYCEIGRPLIIDDTNDSDEILSFSYNVYRKFFEEEGKILDWECENND